MKKYKIWFLFLLLLVFTCAAAWFHLSTRQTVPEGALQIFYDGQTITVDPHTLPLKKLSGTRVNGIGETIPVEGEGLFLLDLLNHQAISSFSRVTVASADEYRAELSAEEVSEAGKACLLFQDEELRLIVFGDPNSKRSVSRVVRITVQ